MHRARNATLLGLAFAGMSILAACGDSTTAPQGPGAFDAQAAETSLDAMDGLMASAAWASYQALSVKIGGSGVVSSRVPAPNALEGLPAAGDAASRLWAAVSQVPLISTGNLGNTFVIDPATGEYAVDPARAGAPSNGVRFILYALIEGTENPDLSVEIGHVDLVDQGATTAGIDLRLTAVADGLTFVQYGVGVEGDETNLTVGIDGFVSDGTDQLDFDFNVTAVQNGNQTVTALDATLRVDSHGLAITVAADGTAFDGQDGSLTVLLSVRYGSESLSIDVAGDDTAIDVTVKINGAVFATATGDPEAPVILGANGTELTENEIRVLGEIIDTADEIFRFFDDLVKPAEGIILLAVIL